MPRECCLMGRVTASRVDDQGRHDDCYVLIDLLNNLRARLLNVRLPLLLLGRVYGVILMLYRQHPLSIESHLDEGFISLRKPESINFLVLSDKVGPFDPERQFPRRMPFDPNHRIVVGINPQLALKQIFVFPLGDGLRDVAMVRSDLLFAQQVQGIVRGRDGAVVMLLACWCFDLARDEWTECHLANES